MDVMFTDPFGKPIGSVEPDPLDGAGCTARCYPAGGLAPPEIVLPTIAHVAIDAQTHDVAICFHGGAGDAEIRVHLTPELIRQLAEYLR